jgi:nicotinamidase/pyrazinamidase
MKALIVVDMQEDFLPGGALGVPEGEAVIPEIVRLMEAPGS